MHLLQRSTATNYHIDMIVRRPGPDTTSQQTSVVVSKITPAVMQAALDWQVKMHADPKYFGARLLIEPFFTGSLQVDDSNTAWPHSSPSVHIIMIIIERPNGDAAEEKDHLRAAERSIAAAAEPGTVLLKYPNNALVGNPAVEFYGKNLPRLQAIKKRVDPKNRFNKGIQII
jgi:FAD/FMN-containing dehydrogenase